MIMVALIGAFSTAIAINYYRDRDADAKKATILKDTNNTDIRDVIPGQIFKITGEVKPIENAEFEPARVGEEVFKRKEQIRFDPELKEVQKEIIETKSVDFTVADGTGKIVVSLGGTCPDGKEKTLNIEITGQLDSEEYQSQYEYISCEISIKVGDIIEILGKCELSKHHSGIYRQIPEALDEIPKIRISGDESPIYIHVRRRGVSFPH